MISYPATFHYRFDNDGNLTTDTTKFSSKGGFTVTFNPKNGILVVGTARCSFDDSFVRKIGHSKSLGRSIQLEAPILKNTYTLNELGDIGAYLAKAKAFTHEKVKQYLLYYNVCEE